MNCSRSPLAILLVIVVAFTAVLAFLDAGLAFFRTTRVVHAATLEVMPEVSEETNSGKGYRFERGGWIYVHLEGSPHDIGYQHGYLLAPEIADAYSAVSLEMTHSANRDWNFFRRAARQMLWPKLIPSIKPNCRELWTVYKPTK